MAHIGLGVSAGLATAMGVVGAVASYGEGSFTVGTILVIAVLGSVSVHAVVSPQSYRNPRFTGAFYRVWAAVVPLLAVAALVTSTSSPDTAARVAYWSGFATIALFAGAVVEHRSTRTTVPTR